MPYHTVYEAPALDEALIWAAVVVWPLMLLAFNNKTVRPVAADPLDEEWTIFWIRRGVLILFAVAYPLLVYTAWDTTIHAWWTLRQGAYEVDQGRASNVWYQPAKNGITTQFNLGAHRYSYHDRAGRTSERRVVDQGDVNEGTLVRLAHVDGNILRMEIGVSPPPTAAPPRPGPPNRAAPRR